MLDVRTDRDLVVPGEPVGVEVELWNGGPFALSAALPELELPAEWQARAVLSETGGRSQGGPGGGVTGGEAPRPAPAGGFEPREIPPGGVVRWTFQVSVPATAEPSRPYFLEEERDGSLYRWPADPALRGLPANPPLVTGSADFVLHLVTVDGRVADGPPAGPAARSAAPAAGGPAGSAAADAAGPRRGTPGGVRLRASRAASYVGVDKAAGEFRAPLLVVPALSIRVEPATLAWSAGDDEPRELVVEVEGFAAGAVEGEVTLAAPAGWAVSPASYPLRLEREGPGGGAGRSYAFRIWPGDGGALTGRYTFRARATTADGRSYAEALSLIDYPHVERMARFLPAETRVSVFPVSVANGLRVGYVMGSGDAGFETLRQLGVDVELLDEEAVRRGDFGRFDVVVLGVRVYETRPDVAAANDRLLDFARRGGTVLVQYNKYEYPAGGFAPFPVEMARPHDRVTDPDVPVRLLDPDSPVFQRPNRITARDFEGWVQERGLYFLSEWDGRYTPLLEMSDPGEPANRGSLVVAPVGDGLYIYTGLAFFRQLPAGVPGAHRLFANLVSLRAHDWTTAHGTPSGGSAGGDAGSPRER